MDGGAVIILYHGKFNFAAFVPPVFAEVVLHARMGRDIADPPAYECDIERRAERAERWLYAQSMRQARFGRMQFGITQLGPGARVRFGRRVDDLRKLV